MTLKPLPFLVKPGPKPPRKEQREKRKIPMTLVAALSGGDGTILFADTEEVVGAYSTRKIDKLAVWDCDSFRVGIAGATTDGTYADMLQAEILAELSKLPVFDIRAINTTLSDVLTAFYSKHIWPRAGEKPQMEYLMVIQPLPQGHPEVIYISETAANIVHEEYRTVGVGRYLADYIFKQIFQAPLPVSGRESFSLLCAAGVYAAKEVRENIDGVGPVDRIAAFGRNGEYDELYPVDISKIEESLSSIQEFLGYFYGDVMDVDNRHFAREPYADGFIQDIRSSHQSWYDEWKNRLASRQRIRNMLKKKAADSGNLA